MRTASSFALALALAVTGAVVAEPAVAQRAPTRDSQQTQAQAEAEGKEGQEGRQQQTRQAAPGEVEVGGRKLKLSKDARKPIAELQAAFNAGNAAGFTAALAKADAAARNSDDRYYIGQLRLAQAIKANDDAQKVAAIDALIRSGGASAEELPKYYQTLGALHYNAKRFDQAAAMFQKLVELQPTNKDAANNLAAALMQTNNPAQAAATLEQQIAAAKAAGQTVPEATYKQALAIAYKAKSPKSIELARDIVAAYPTTENWRNALGIYRELKKPTGDANLDLLRLMRATRSLASERDFYELADGAYSKGLPGETKSVLDEGVAAGTVSPNKAGFKELISGARGKVAEDRASLAASEKKAMAGTSGTLALNTGDAYMGYGDYAKAAALYRAALQKGGVDANLVNTRLGMALGLAGQKAEAQAALKAVTGARAELASYWLIWLNQRG
jgi:tetratricopeptide (TPR) repeat protein